MSSDPDYADFVSVHGVVSHIAEDEGYNGLMLTKKDMEDLLKEQQWKQAYVADAHGQNVGRIAGMHIDGMNRLVANLEVSTKANPELVRKLESGQYKGLSLGMINTKDNASKDIVGKRLKEISVCEEGDIPGTEIFLVRRHDRNKIRDHHKELDERLERPLRDISQVLTTASKDSPRSMSLFTIDSVGQGKTHTHTRQFFFFHFF